jgi:hypothetical protein
MTTVVYDYKSNVIALDSRAVNNGSIITDCAEKFFIIGQEYFFYSGLTCDIKYFKNLIDVKGKPEFSCELNCFRIKDGDVYFCGTDVNDGYWEELADCNQSHGSGGKLALSALDFGKSAIEAVEYAKTRDIHTGGLVRAFSVDKLEWLT